MKALVAIGLSLYIASCSSSDWSPAGVSHLKKTWRICSEDKDGSEKDLKGFCYIDKECRINWIKQCRPKPLFCPWGDIPCLRRYKLLDKKLK